MSSTREAERGKQMKREKGFVSVFLFSFRLLLFFCPQELSLQALHISPGFTQFRDLQSYLLIESQHE